MSLRKIQLVLGAVAVCAMVPDAAAAGGHGMGYDVKNVGDLEFVPWGDTPLEIALLWGDLETGPSGFLLKVPAGYENEPHSHTADYRLFIIEGTGLHWGEGETRDDAMPVTAGGYWMQPGGGVHADANGGDGPGLALVIFDGPFDSMPAE